MDPDTILQLVRNKIADNKIPEALAALQSFLLESGLENAKTYLTSLTVFKSNHSRVRESINLNLVEISEGEREINKISFGLLALIDKLEQEWNSSGTTSSKNLTPNVHLSLPKKFIGLDNAITSLRESLENSRIPILIHGFGGVGKTTLAQNYFERYHNEYDYFAWLNFYEDIPKTFVESSRDLISSYFTEEKIKKENTSEQFGKIIKTWKGLRGKKLLIIDGLGKSLESPDIQLLSILCRNYDWQILITSRRSEPQFEVFSLEPPDLETAKALYFHYRKDHKQEETTESVEALLQFLGHHPLMIERSANLIKSSFITTPASLLETFEKKGLMGLAGGNARSGSADQSNAAEEYLRIVFNIDNLDRSLIDLLAQVATIAVIPLSFEMIAFALAKEEEEKIMLDEHLNRLVEHGWLARKGDKVVMHQIIRQVAIMQAKGAFYQILLETLGTRIYEEFDKDYSKWYDFQSYRPLLEELQKRVQEESIPYSDLLYNLSYLSYMLDIGQERAADFAKKCIAIIEDSKDTDNLRLGLAYNNLSLILKARKEMESAFFYQDLAFKLRKNSGQKYPYAESLLNLGLLYSDESDKKDLNKAIDLISRSVEIEEELYPEGHPHLSNCYENLAWVYELDEQLPKAEEYQRKALEINEKIFPHHPYLVDSYCSLANLLFKHEKKEAIDYWMNALVVGEKIFQPESERLANLYYEFSEFLMLSSESGLYPDQYDSFQVTALNSLQQARIIMEKIYSRPELVHIYLLMAQVFFNLQELGNAEEFVLEAGDLIWEAEQNEIELHESWKEFQLELENKISFDQKIARQWYCNMDLVRLFETARPEDRLLEKKLTFTLVKPGEEISAHQSFYRFDYGELSKISFSPDAPEEQDPEFIGRWQSNENLDGMFIGITGGYLLELKRLRLDDEIMEWVIDSVSLVEE